MKKYWGRIIEEKIKSLIRIADYTIYLLLDPFKFKRFPTEIKRILVIELLLIGDLIVTTPVIRALKEKYPKASLDVMVLPTMKEVLEGNKYIESIILYKASK